MGTPFYSSSITRIPSEYEWFKSCSLQMLFNSGAFEWKDLLLSDLKGLPLAPRFLSLDEDGPKLLRIMVTAGKVCI